MAEAIALENDDNLRETERFVRLFNKFFDIMNIRCITEYVRTRNPDKKPFYDENDDRLKVCMTDIHVYSVHYKYSM